MSCNVSNSPVETTGLVEAVESLKSRGNEAMKGGSLVDAKAHYTEAIEMSSGLRHDSPLLVSQLFSNRAAVHLSLRNLQEAVRDCQSAIDVDSSNLKAYWRGAKASLQLNNFKDAIKFCNEGLKIDPNHVDILELKRSSEAKLLRADSVARGFTKDDALSCQDLVNQLKEQLYLVNQKIQAYEFETARNSRTTSLVTESPEQSPLYSSVGRGFIRVSRENVFKGLNDRSEEIKTSLLPDCLATRETLSKRLKAAESELTEMIEYFKQHRSNE
jgi:tetratricopeptide (TPR) repeat protein